jgi:hypothetical protein
MSRHTEYLKLFDVRRDEWDPNDNTPAVNRTVARIDRFEAHHTGASGPLAMSFEAKRGWLRGIESYHENTKGWTDIFYHVFVFADGEIWEGRRIDRTSQASIATTVTVHYPGMDPVVTPEQAASAMRVARWAVTDPALISYHSERGATSCPGDNVRQHIQELRKGFNVSDLSNLPPIQLIPEDLRSNRDYLDAVEKGFISSADPDRVASRSVCGIVANRVDEASVAATDSLQAQINDLAAEVRRLDSSQSDVDAVVNRVVNILINRLAE